jgi:peptidoglycan/LPS O-acetylase OafA/YrhL
MENPATTKHLPYLDGLRALTAIYVVLYHSVLQLNFRGQPPGAFARGFLQCFLFGHYAVAVFIALSGFCLMLPIVRGDGVIRGGAVQFLVRRAWRILPPYYCAMAFSLILVWLLIGQKTGTHWDVSIPVTGRSILLHLLLVQDLFAEQANINHVFWSISVEWRVYFLFPLIVLAWARFGTLVTALATVALSYLVLQCAGAWLGNPLAAHYIGIFALGALAAAVAFPSGAALGWLARLPWAWITAGMTLAVALTLFPAWWGGPHVHIYIADYLVGVWSMALLAAVAGNPDGWLGRALSFRPLVFVGTFAYSLYLIHAPLLQVLWQYVFWPLQGRPLWMFAALALVGTPLIAGVSYGFFLICERPFLAREKRAARQAGATGAPWRPSPWPAPPLPTQS